MQRRREGIRSSPVIDPKQRNLFDVYEPGDEGGVQSSDGEDSVPLVDFGELSTDDDLILAYISQKILIAIEDSSADGQGLHFDEITSLLESPGISSEDIDESISWLLQKSRLLKLKGMFSLSTDERSIGFFNTTIDRRRAFPHKHHDKRNFWVVC